MQHLRAGYNGSPPILNPPTRQKSHLLSLHTQSMWNASQPLDAELTHNQLHPEVVGVQKSAQLQQPQHVVSVS